MSELTKEWLQKTIVELEEERDAVPGAVNEDAAKALAAMKLALASIEAEPAQEWTNEQCLEFLSIAFRHAEIKGDLELDDIRLGVKMANGSRAAMLQGAEPVSQHPELTVWYGSMPETNGKANWTAILHRKGECLSTGITIERSEFPDRVLYEADRVRYLIGEKADRPCILDYDADAHSGYVKPGNCPAIPDDVRRMDWLVSKTVDVREPMVYGSHSLFWSQTITDEEDDYHATKLREQIDAAMAAENAAAPQQEVNP